MVRTGSSTKEKSKWRDLHTNSKTFPFGDVFKVTESPTLGYVNQSNLISPVSPDKDDSACSVNTVATECIPFLLR